MFARAMQIVRYTERAVSLWRTTPLTYCPSHPTIVIFIETVLFTRQLENALDDDAYWAFQRRLAGDPSAGSVVRASGGIRKLRWALPGKGKRGSLRVMYYWRSTDDHIFLLCLFRKGERANLTDSQLKELAKYVREHLK